MDAPQSFFVESRYDAYARHRRENVKNPPIGELFFWVLARVVFFAEDDCRAFFDFVVFDDLAFVAASAADDRFFVSSFGGFGGVFTSSGFGSAASFATTA